MKNKIEIKVIKILRSQQCTGEAQNGAASGDPVQIQHVSNREQEPLDT